MAALPASATAPGAYSARAGVSGGGAGASGFSVGASGAFAGVSGCFAGASGGFAGSAGRLTARSYSLMKPPIWRFRILAIDGRMGAILLLLTLHPSCLLSLDGPPRPRALSAGAVWRVDPPLTCAGHPTQASRV